MPFPSPAVSMPGRLAAKPSVPTPAAQPLRMCEPGRRLLVLKNPGRVSRFYLEGILAGLGRLGVQHDFIELQGIWDVAKSKPAELVRHLSQILVRQRVGAVLGYGFNGVGEIPLDAGPLAAMRSFFEIRGIPHLMLWLDHPQWHADLTGLRPDMQGMFRSSNSIHLLKNAAHALEMERLVGWPNCFELPAAVDPEQFPIAPQAELRGGAPRYDLVAICSEKGELPRWLMDFVALDDPNPVLIRRRILEEVRADLEQLWKREVAGPLRPEMSALGVKWSGLKAEQPFAAAVRHWHALVEEFPGPCWYLTLQYPTYMKAIRILWRIREWERRFYLAYLAKYFRVGVFGGDWSPLGLGPGGWVDFLRQSEIYAQGRVALNITDGHDEEGVTLKPFEIAASGVAMVHYRAEGLERCFTPGSEVEVFETPREARERLEALLDDRERRIAMAEAAHARVLAEHTWERRVERMFEMARLPIEAFREPACAGN